MTETSAHAYFYGGDWVADCTRPGCASAEFLMDPIRKDIPANPFVNPRTVRRPAFVCSYCGMAADIIWPDPRLMAELEGVLALRPLPHTRNWYPDGHANAGLWGLPTGQTPDDLRQENAEHDVATG